MKNLVANNPTAVKTGWCPYHSVINLLNWLGYSKKSATASDPLNVISQPRCPYARTKSDLTTNVDSLSMTTQAGDPAANQLLDQTRAKIYHWPESFSGFSARVMLRSLSGDTTVPFQVSRTGKVEAIWPNSDEGKWLKDQVGEIVSHRIAPTHAEVNKKGVAFDGPENDPMGTKIKFVDDRMQSFYRIKNERLVEIGRCYPGTRFVVSIFDHHRMDDKFCARGYSVHYWNIESKALIKAEAYVDDYVEREGFFLPSRRIYTQADGDGLTTRELLFSYEK
ncbi:MAG: DUF3386 family protein [Verrucomicrobiota bacterium]|nr:DUF3386 family protein [Verrucomicrobiota bacterium]